MGDRSKIAWTDATWNPVRGCSPVSEGCENCYAVRMARRMDKLGGAYENLTEWTLKDPKVRWSGHARFVPEQLDKPLRWRKPRKVFVVSMGDLFHEDISFEQIASVFGAMAACPQHTFQILTKRPQRMLDWLRWIDANNEARLDCAAYLLAEEVKHDGDGGPIHCKYGPSPEGPWPLSNVWLGVTAENQARADERIPLLLECPAAVRFVSVEPMLGPVNLQHISGLAEWTVDVLRAGSWPTHPNQFPGFVSHSNMRTLDWIILGCETGPGARPMEPVWGVDLVEQCQAAGVPVFVKKAPAAVPEIQEFPE